MDKSIASEPNYQGPDGRNSISVEQKAQIPVIIDDGMWVRKIFDKLGRTAIIANRLDYYANAIPLGAFCCAFAFIIYGFYRARVYNVNDTFLWAVILLFGGVGQLTAGFLEFIKGRTFPATIFLTYGAYCLSHYFLYILPRKFGTYDRNIQLAGQNYFYSDPATLCTFYSMWTVIGFGVLLASFRSNIWFVLLAVTTFVFFMLRAIGEGTDSLGTKKNAAGIVEAIAGFFALFIGISQILNNETFHNQCFPVFPLAQENEIDVEQYYQ